MDENKLKLEFIEELLDVLGIPKTDGVSSYTLYARVCVALAAAAAGKLSKERLSKALPKSIQGVFHD